MVPTNLREVDAERGIHDALREQRHHDQPRHNEGAIVDVIDLGNPRADRRAEHHEIQRRRNHRRHDALEDRAPGARHLEPVYGPDRVPVHASFLTRSTKMSSSELCVVPMSLQTDALPKQLLDEPRDAAMLALRLIGVDQRVTVVGKREVIGGKRRRDRGKLLLQLEFHLLLAELAHQRRPCPRPGSSRPC